ncbi:MAG: manganese efflux pump MntP family protein [Sphingomonadaceae bacterium]|uniref:manganese efflux pump n=1 Tax=Thermaurantiacus sp. TaxID=2820283 RepID=UPI00298EFD72|nr:manganese efflux pump [Thermaurantiacus sp.]MCS6987266.1 manganese efflux pump MntP family protein [Sphingomonadaceae bacterium]MDW8414486.1 manganese efflux pump [Thermaurantiacus sp.]
MALLLPPLELLALAVGLAADATAVALARGLAVPPGTSRWRSAAATGLAFGSAQALMPLLGLGVAIMLVGPFVRAAHWLAFVVLAVLGIGMMRKGLSGQPAAAPAALLPAALATSLDAAAAGVALPLLGWPAWASVALIGVVTAGLAAGAVLAGAAAGAWLGSRATAAGGAILVLVGLRIAWGA